MAAARLALQRCYGSCIRLACKAVYTASLACSCTDLPAVHLPPPGARVLHRRPVCPQVFAFKQKGPHMLWRATEGVYFPPRTEA